MQIEDRLKWHLKEAEVHAERLRETLEVLREYYPVDKEKASVVKDKLDVLAFRFAKLQDLMGNKIFREYLESVEYLTTDKSFLDLLRELEKEGIVHIDTWAEFREVRNAIAHDYPYEEHDRLDAINYLITNVPYLIEVTKRIKNEIDKQRDQDHPKTHS